MEKRNLQLQVLVAASAALVVVALYAVWCQVTEPSAVPIPRTTATAVKAPPLEQLEAAASHPMGAHIAASTPAPPAPAPAPAGPPQPCPFRMPVLAITCTTNEPLPRLLQWMRYHQTLGFSVFYFFVEGSAEKPDVIEELRKLSGVKVFPRDKRLQWWNEHDRIHHENSFKMYFGQPCNGELFVKQSINMEIAIEQARVDGVSWIGHIDTDEFLYPASSQNFSMHEVLEPLSHKVHSVLMPNYEGVVEHDQVVDPPREVTLFKVALAFVDSPTMSRHYDEVSHGLPNYFAAYSSGKSIARVLPGLRTYGAHHWQSYNGSHSQYTHPQSGLLHYTYNRFSDLKSRRDRCECAPTETDTKRCFWLPFDRVAYRASSLKTEDELRKMYNEMLVWNETALISRLRSVGLVDRIHAPMLIVKAFPKNIADGMPKRSAQRIADDEAFRAVSDSQVGNYTYAELRPGGRATTCEEFAAEDSSLTVLDLVGPLPPEEDSRDSDAVLVSRMYQYPGMPAAKVNTER